MKIAYLTTSKVASVSANSVHVMKMAHAMAKRGNSVNLFAVEEGDKNVDAYGYYGVDPSFTISFMQEGSFYLTRFLTKLRRIFPFVRLGYLPSVFFGYLCVRKRVIHSEPDLIYSRNIAWLFSLRTSQIDYVLESHRPPRNLIERYVERSLIASNRCRGVVVISNALKNIYLDTFRTIPEDKFIVAHDGADVQVENQIVDKASADKKHVIGYVGHLYEGRGVDLIIKLARNFPKETFAVIGGSASDLSSLRKGIANIPRNIMFVGHVPRSDVDKYLNGFSVVLAPYQRSVAVQGGGDTSAFMSPLKIFEYMASGVPIVASDLPVLREVLEDRRTALLVSPSELQPWVAAINELLLNPKLRSELGAAAREKLANQYSWDKRCSLIFDKVNFDKQ